MRSHLLFSLAFLGCTLACRGCGVADRAGQLGIGNNTGPEVLVTSDGSRFPLSTKPVAVAGGLTFRHVSPGFGHACGVTMDDRVFCWGSNRYGQVGDSTAGWFRFKPRPPQPGCRPYCWDANLDGQLGTGSTTIVISRKPVLVAGPM
jgi:Regulator of Chromosome Condensation (RCC1) repeat protein